MQTYNSSLYRRTYLKDGEQRLPEGVEVASRFVDERVEVELSAEQLHAEQRKDDDEEEEQQQETDDRSHAVEQRRDQVPQRRPVSTNEHF